MWYDEFGENIKPTLANVKQYIGNSLWDELCSFLESSYGVLPQMDYSGCSGQKGWNIKYKKSGKSLCTLYPMDGYFIALVTIGKKELPEFEQILPACSSYIQDLYNRSGSLNGACWLMIEVKNREILEDTMKLIQLRVKIKNAPASGK